MSDPELIARIYEAAALPERWPALLQDLADHVGALGATIVSQTSHTVEIVASPRLEPIVADYVAEGWTNDPAYAAPLLADQYPGFCAETRYRTVEEIERLPVHVEFLAPRGMIAGVATALQGTHNDFLHMAFEGLPSHAAAEAAVPWLDGLRAPLGRAMSLTARLRDGHAERSVGTLDLAGIAAAVVSPEGRLRAANPRFVARMGDRMFEQRGRLRFTHPPLRDQMADVLARLETATRLCSVVVPAALGQAAAVLHILPLRRSARAVFGWDGILILLAEPENVVVPGADLLRLLFDLTPAEARLSRALAEGGTLAEAAGLLSITGATARAHLRSVFGKTGVHRQADLIRLLLGVAGPE